MCINIYALDIYVPNLYVCVYMCVCAHTLSVLQGIGFIMTHPSNSEVYKNITEYVKCN